MSPSGVKIFFDYYDLLSIFHLSSLRYFLSDFLISVIIVCANNILN